MVGIGDDAAVLQRPTSGDLLFCSDAMVEGIHFELSTIPIFDLGYKALASCLSDIAAMNGRALSAVITLALPQTVSPREFLMEFYRGVGALAKKYAVDIVGGDLSSSRSGIFIDVALLGSVENRKTRAGALEGDLVAISGHPGLSAAGFAALQKNLAGWSEAKRAHLRPEPRFDLLPALDRHPGLVTSMIDVSDGLARELYHLSRASRIGFEIDARLLPVHAEAVGLAALLGKSTLDWAFSGGEDYELLVTVAPEHLLDLPLDFTVIGKAQKPGKGIQVIHPSGSIQNLEESGYDHFAEDTSLGSRLKSRPT